MKSSKDSVKPVKSKFYKLDSSKPVAAEGYKSALPWILLSVALFFCLILAFIVIVNKDSDSYDSNDYTIFFVLCGVFLGAALVLVIAYLIRNSVVRKRILSSDVTQATITSVIVGRYTTRDKDGDTHTKENVSLTFAFYDKAGNVRTEHFNKTYGNAPEFYEGQQLVVAFDETKCFVLSKYSLLDDDTEIDVGADALNQEFSGETLSVNVDQYVPLGYDKRYYVLAGFYLVFSLLFAALMTYFAVTIKDGYVWVYVGMSGLMFAVFLILTVHAAFVPFTVKRKYDAIIFVGATYTRGKLESSNKLFGNGAKTVYICKYADINGNERQFSLSKTVFVKKLVRYGDTDVVVAYANDKAVALVKKSEIR